MKNKLLLFILACSALSCSSMRSAFEKIKPVKPQQKIFQLAWTKDMDPPYDSGNLPIGLGGPTIFEGLVYMGDSRGVMRAFQLESGRIIWEQEDKHPLGQPGLIYKDKIIYGSRSGRLIARHYLTGKLIYDVDLGSAIESQPTVYRNRLFVHLRNHTLAALDALTGKILWKHRRSVQYLTTLQRVSRPLAFDNKVYVGFADGFVVCFSVDEGVILWEQKIASGVKFIDVDTTPFIYNGKVYIGSLAGPLTILNATTGFIQKQVDITISRAPIPYQDEDFLVGTIDGKIVQIDENGTLKREIQLDGGHVITGLVKWKDLLVVTTTSSKIFALNYKSLVVESVHNLGSAYSAVFEPPIVSDHFMALYSARNRLYIFR